MDNRKAPELDKINTELLKCVAIGTTTSIQWVLENKKDTGIMETVDNISLYK